MSFQASYWQSISCFFFFFFSFLLSFLQSSCPSILVDSDANSKQASSAIEDAVEEAEEAAPSASSFDLKSFFGGGGRAPKPQVCTVPSPAASCHSQLLQMSATLLPHGAFAGQTSSGVWHRGT